MKVAAVTATRAEFGLLAGLLKEIHGSPQFELQLIVTGTHLLEEFGHTVQEIHSAGIPISRTVHEISHADTGLDVANQVGAGIMSFSRALSELEPDIIVILGDRYEMLAASVAAFFLAIPILHIHGGEVTEGAFDDSIRHAITKLASIHCVAHEDYRRRVIQMGEHPDTVHVVGALGADEISKAQLKPRDVLQKELGFEFGGTMLLVTQHPVTVGPRDTHAETVELINALSMFSDATVVFTMPNADPEHRTIENLIKRAVSERQSRWYFFESLGQTNYWSLMAQASAVVGNSSSGILEAPLFRVPTVNIGDRQKGRIHASSVVDCDSTADSIAAKVRIVLQPSFRDGLTTQTYPFGGPGAVERILAAMTAVSPKALPRKVFCDIDAGQNGGRCDNRGP